MGEGREGSVKECGKCETYMEEYAFFRDVINDNRTAYIRDLPSCMDPLSMVSMESFTAASHCMMPLLSARW